MTDNKYFVPKPSRKIHATGEENEASQRNVETKNLFFDADRIECSRKR